MRSNRRASVASGALLIAMGIGALILPCSALGEACIVKEGRPQAEIIISRQPPRMTKLAAEELQSCVEKISGARLPITTAPGKDVPVQIYVGRSTYTDQLKIADEGLKSGAFKMVSGGNWLVLLGHDSDFAPKGPFHSGGALTEDSSALIEWDKLTGKKWGFPAGNLFKTRNGPLNIWELDERGSFNAVTEFLRMQGVRWYLPGKLGEVLPQKTTIVLPQVNKTVRPDFRLRYPYQYAHMFGHTTREEVLWQLRLGLYNGPDPVAPDAHGLRLVHERAETKKTHPEYFALYGGKRDSETFGGGRPCLSSEGLFRENLQYVHAMFDIFDAPMVSVMPQDGYVNICQCDLCKGKDTPGRGWTGQISDYVWDYVNRVAKEVYKTNPDRKVTCAAYGAYLLPPEKIDKLSPNVVVEICQQRSEFHDRAAREQFVKLREAWLKKLPPGSQLVIADYYLHARPNMPWDGVPVFYPRLIAEDLHSLKGISVGEFIETYRDLGESLRSLAANHLNLYVTARFWWDADQDVDALLDEYYTLFYGPARDEMKAFIEYSESNWMNMAKSAEKIGQVFELLARAQQKAPADSVYGKRIAIIAGYIQPMKALGEQLAKGRKDAPKARVYWRAKADLKMDGKLDEEFWQGMATYPLNELQTGKPIRPATSFKVAWAGDSLYVGITCQEPDTKKLNIGTTRNEDPSIWNGDYVEILLETQTHAYYQIAINPAGAMTDVDRKGETDTLWSSGAEVAAHIGDGYWSVEVRIPARGEGQEQLDPRNGVSGRRPNTTYPWYFNICRQRVREKQTEASAFSATGKPSVHVPMKFAELVVR